MSQNDLNKIDLVIIISTIPGVPLAPGWFAALNSLPVVILGHFWHAWKWWFSPKIIFFRHVRNDQIWPPVPSSIVFLVPIRIQGACTCFLGGSDPHWLTHRSRRSSVDFNRPAGFHRHTCEGKHTCVHMYVMWRGRHKCVETKTLNASVPRRALSAFQNSKQFPTTTMRQC